MITSRMLVLNIVGGTLSVVLGGLLIVGRSESTSEPKSVAVATSKAHASDVGEVYMPRPSSLAPSCNSGCSIHAMFAAMPRP